MKRFIYIFLLSVSLFTFHFSLSNAQVIKNPVTKRHSIHKSNTTSTGYFKVGRNRVKYDVYHTDTVYINDTTPPFVTSVAEYVWDTINHGYIYVVKERRLFCNGVMPGALEGDLKNMLKIIPPKGFRYLSRSGGEFNVTINEAIYDGGADSLFVAVDISGFIGADADFEEHGVVGMRYADLEQYNDSLYKPPYNYPMNRFDRDIRLR